MVGTLIMKILAWFLASGLLASCLGSSTVYDMACYAGERLVWRGKVKNLSTDADASGWRFTDQNGVRQVTSLPCHASIAGKEVPPTAPGSIPDSRLEGTR